MKELKQFIQDRGIGRIGISRFYSNIPLGEMDSPNPKEKHPMYLEIHYLNKWLREECGIEPDIIRLTPIRKQYAGVNQVLYKDVDLGEYDLLIMQPQSFLLMAGMIRVYTLRFIQQFNREVQCPVIVTHTDPDYAWTNPFSFFTNRKGTPIKYVNSTKEWEAGIRREIDPTPTEGDVDTFNNKEYYYLFSGRDFNSYISQCTTVTHMVDIPNHIDAGYFEYMGLSEIERSPTQVINVEEKEWDVCYYGRNRKQRTKLLESLLNNDKLSKLLIGKDLPQWPMGHNIEAVPREKLPQYAHKAWVSIMVVDPAHANNMVTFRYFEDVINGVWTVIYKPQDEEMRYIDDEKLRPLTYFSTIEELVDIVNWFKSNPEKYVEYLHKQRECKIKYFKSRI